MSKPHLVRTLSAAGVAPEPPIARIPKSFWRGLVASLPFLPVVAPFAALFGALATGAGLSILETMGFSVLVIAGTAQFTALQLMTEEAPTLVILVTSLIVNLRMAMYSAAFAPHFGTTPLWVRMGIGYLNVDQSYAASALEFERRPEMQVADKLGYFFGLMLLIAATWYAATLIGALWGPGILPERGPDVFLPLTFFAMIAPGLTTWPHRIAALTAAGASLALSALPYALGLLPAAGLGMIVGAELERRAKLR